MGLFDFFKRRRERESAVQVDESGSQPLGTFASSEGQPVVGGQVGGGQPDLGSLDITSMGGFEALAQLGPMIQKAIAEGNVTIEQGPSQTIDLRGTGLREEIVGIMQQHGIDPEGQGGQNVNAADYGTMQQQILDALAKRGIDPNASGSTLDLRVQKDDE